MVIDYYSGYPEVACVPNLITSMVTAKLESMLARWEIPEFVISDNGLLLSSKEFGSFSKKYRLVHILRKQMEKQKVG